MGPAGARSAGRGMVLDHAARHVCSAVQLQWMRDE
jgi:hypothetical protein